MSTAAPSYQPGPGHAAARLYPSSEGRLGGAKLADQGNLDQLLQGHGAGSSPSNGNVYYQTPSYEAAAPTSIPSIVQDVVRRQVAEETFTASNTSELPTSATTIQGQPSATATALSHQNLLAIMPDFAFSMPAQIVVAGINIALVSVLGVHLLFTVHYHLPLSRANWSLQISSTLILLINLSVHLNTNLTSLEAKSHQWPFMFPYLASGLPPGDGSWTKVQEAFFLLMRAITTVLIHLTHIQFLTLLFPSALEARLILWMLGPLAIAAAGMEFTWLSPEDDVKTSDLGDAIRNICNSTLTLLYTCALIIWGGLVNRRRAWRSDGGTAAFGGGAMGLAVMNTAMSFVQIRYDRLWWLPDICWTLTIWQSWLGFWWWCGAGMGIGEVEDRAEREARRKKRREKIKRKLEKEERQRRKAEQAAEDGSDVLLGIKRIKDKITLTTTSEGGLKDSTLSRRIRGKAEASTENEDIELREIATHAEEGQDDAAAGEQPDRQAGRDGPALTSVSVVDDHRTQDGSSDSNPTTSAQTGPTHSHSGWMGRVGEMVDHYQPSFIRRRMRRLRIAHAAAAKKAATEQTILRNQVLNANRQPGLRAMMFDHAAQAQGSGPGQGGGGRSSRRASAVPQRGHGAEGEASRDSGARRASSLASANPFASSTRVATTATSPSSDGGPALAGDQRSVLARASQDGCDGGEQDQEWIDERHGEEDRDEDEDDSPGSGTAQPVAEEVRRARWRQGIDRVRLRDRQRYD
ncbi:hypothetical protein BDZ90DRAFT_230879 [Jaminaea rosea]|uniref:Uncharacterized protein n=1 Tax=Jaminaea rosea TaxID=1569628 RepID=A0A316UUF2_9BASI|nr:hypothetical protein BDZ90DRAFT_230879 [Jaminaea rosea]PWN28872.1 hypothetical protein BDZ90DRAFT_230879 [Jaminaea rosea]